MDKQLCPAPHSPLPDCAREDPRARGHAASSHDGRGGCRALNWVHRPWHHCALISTVGACWHRPGAQHFQRQSIWEVQMF